MLYAVSREPGRTEFDGCSLLAAFARRRRSEDDVYWLKENTELLRILVSTHTVVPSEALSCYDSFYERAASRLQFFPQYYRFILSITCDLESLGYHGELSTSLKRFVSAQGLMAGELSDLQRLEACCLMGSVDSIEDASSRRLRERVRQFCENVAFFAVPNRKAAFELTHAVFYASRYGNNSPAWLGDVSASLQNAGMVAFLDDDMDLLAEVAVALRYCGDAVPVYWEQVLGAAHQQIQAEPAGNCVASGDHYHEALTLGWAASLRGLPLFANGFSKSDTVFARRQRNRQPSPLRELSHALWESGDNRSASWDHFLSDSGQQLSDRARARVHALDASCAGFPGFFTAFSRSVSVLAHG